MKVGLVFVFAVKGFIASAADNSSFETVAGYSPATQVTDQCAIDLDQQIIEEQLSERTQDGFDRAFLIYKHGGHSKSYAKVELYKPLSTAIQKNTRILGKNAAGYEVAGLAYDDYDAEETTIRVEYQRSDVQAKYVECQVGALPSLNQNLDGCFADDGTIDIGDDKYAYKYNPLVDNNNGRTIQGFSTKADKEMRHNDPDVCSGCPYTDHGYFYEYYGNSDYGDQWITAAFGSEKTRFQNGDADFSLYGFEGREQAIKRAMVYMNVFMFAIREFEDSLDHCERECTINCSEFSVHAWDKGVCLYTGSIEGQTGQPKGVLHHQKADHYCGLFKTCGPEGNRSSGKSAVNYKIFDYFVRGKFELQSGNCYAARQTVKELITHMYIPLIQATQIHAYNFGEERVSEKEKAGGATIAGAVLPRIYAADRDAAATIYQNMKVGATTTNWRAVKQAFEKVYGTIGISCKDVGGLWDGATKDYHQGMHPCVATDTVTVVAKQSGEGPDKLAIILGVTFGTLFAMTAVILIHMTSREKAGQPVFTAEDTNPVS